MPDLGPCMAEWCSRPAAVAIAGPTSGPSPRLTVIGGGRALQMVDSELGALSARCLDCAWAAVERVATAEPARGGTLPASDQEAACCDPGPYCDDLPGCVLNRASDQTTEETDR